jgi:hypothetical protein
MKANEFVNCRLTVGEAADACLAVLGRGPELGFETFIIFAPFARPTINPQDVLELQLAAYPPTEPPFFGCVLHMVHRRIA